MEPMIVHDDPPVRPKGNSISRFIRSVWERRIPYTLQLWLDRILSRLGFKYKIVSARGMRIRTRRLTWDEIFVENVIRNEEYTSEGFQIAEDDLVIDIGGNIGCFAMYAAACAKLGRVITIEPSQECFELLQGNIARNQLDNVTEIRAAISAQSGIVQLRHGVDSGLHTIVEERNEDPSSFEAVPAITLQSLFDSMAITRCDFLKIDCEGAEYDILYNLPHEYFARIRRISMELHQIGNTPKRETFDPLVDFIQQRGFEIIKYVDFVEHDTGVLRAQAI